LSNRNVSRCATCRRRSVSAVGGRPGATPTRRR